MFICVYLWLIPFSYAQESITVAVASSYAEKAKAYAESFSTKERVKVRLVQGATGRLYHQIQQGAPFDVLIAAGQAYSAKLKGKHRVVAHGYVGIRIGQQVLHDAARLEHGDIKRIVIANPKVAPLGQATQRFLQQEGLWHALQSKMVYAQSALQAAMMVDKGLVDAGFVPVSEEKDAVVSVVYEAVLLTDKRYTRMFFQGLKP